MIFVTVGTHEQQFNRLIKAIDNYALKYKISKNEIVIQTGYSDYKPIYCNSKRMFSVDEMKYYYENANIIISHGGPGSMFVPWKLGKKVIAVPRQKEYGEHIDNHQVYFCKAMHDQGKLVSIVNIEELEDIINNFLSLEEKNNQYIPNTTNFIKKFRQEIDNLMLN